MMNAAELLLVDSPPSFFEILNSRPPPLNAQRPFLVTLTPFDCLLFCYFSTEYIFSYFLSFFLPFLACIF